MRQPRAWHPRYVNRELSWLEFNRRVLAEADKASNPLLERIKFLAIFESNYDEFYMVRVSGLIEQEEQGIRDLTPDGLTPSEQLRLIHEKAEPMRQLASKMWMDKLEPALARKGIRIVAYESLKTKERELLEEYYLQAVFPLLTPLMLEPAITFPFISNRSLNLAVELEDEGQPKLARVKIPPVLPRATAIPGRTNEFVLLEDLISCNLQNLFPGVEVKGAHLFRVIRDADVEIRELEAADLISAVEQSLRLRRFGDPVLLEVSPTLPVEWRDKLLVGLQLDHSDCFVVNGLLGFEMLWELTKVERPDLKFSPYTPFLHPRLAERDSLFEVIRERSVLVHHPFDSFQSVQLFVGSVAEDPAVMGVKQTLYRVGAESPIVESLLAGAEAGKQVAVMVELKARFDESNNLIWSRALERSGVHVTYGFPQMKTHCKLCLVVRKEGGAIRSYAHIGTGNYNPSTARLYTDLGIFTDDEDICRDVSELFNFLTGFSKQSSYRKLLVAPLNVRESIIELIRKEADLCSRTGSGRIIFKLNSLVDPEVIDALYEANEAGVKIDLIVRGICCLRPGVRGLSEKIRVVSIVGRFLEHSRVYYFENQGDPVAYVGSADMMRRNLDRRIEVLAPVEDQQLAMYLRDEVLEPCLKDNTNSWLATKDGTYRRRGRRRGEDLFSVQEYQMSKPATQLLDERPRTS